MLVHDGRRGALRRLGAPLTVALLLAAACGDDDDDTSADDTAADEGSSGGGDATDVLGPIDEASGEPVVVGFISDGQSASIDLSVEFEAAEATVEYVNTHLGGIGGRPLELVTCEAKLDPAIAGDCGSRMVEEQVSAVLVATTGVAEAVWQPIHDAGVPSFWFAGTAEPMLTDPDNTFMMSNPLGSSIDVPLAAAEEEDADRAIAVLIDVPAAVEPFQNEGIPAFEDAGIEMELVRVPPGTPEMIGQLQPAIDGTDLVHMVGNDSFCIAAFQGLATLGYEGTVTAVSPCLSDATRTALTGGELEGVIVPSAVPYGVEDETTELVRAVFDEYGSGDIDLTRAAPANTFLVVAGFATAMQDIGADVTSESIITTAQSMPDRELPGSAGLHIRCGGVAVEGNPAVCVRGVLTATLDAEGNVTAFEPTDTEPIGD